MTNPVDEDDLQVLIEEDKEEEMCYNSKKFKGFSFPELPFPFLYGCQSFIHILHIFLPLIHLFVKMCMCHTCISGVDILTSLGQFVAWCSGFKALKVERFHFFLSKIKMHSVLMLLFWTVALLFDIIVFVSWKSLNWYMSHPSGEIKQLDLITFCLRLFFSVILFILGLLGPGLYKDHYDQELAVDKKSDDKDKKVRLHFHMILIREAFLLRFFTLD